MLYLNLLRKLNQPLQHFTYPYPIAAIYFVIGYVITLAIQPVWADYLLTFHLVIEYICTFVAFLIFFITWRSADEEVNNYYLVGIGFLIVGIIDSLHTFFYTLYGLNYGISGELAAKFWVQGRLAEALILLLLAAGSPLFIQIPKTKQFVSGFLMFGILILFNFLFPNRFQMWSADGSTSLKIGFGYLTIGILVLSHFLLLAKDLNKSRAFDINAVQSAILLSIVSEICFTQQGSDLLVNWHLFGHVLKLMSYLFLFHGFLLRLADRPVQRLEQKLQTQSNLLDQVFKNSPTGIALISMDGAFVHVNDSFCAIIVRTQAQLQEMTYADLFGIAAEELAGLNEAMVARPERSFQQIRKYKTQEGQEKRIRINKMLLCDVADAQELILVQLEDVTADHEVEVFRSLAYRREKMLAEAKALERLRDDFFANLSHEFKTPLNLIFSSLQIMELYLSQDSIQTDRAQSQIRIMRQNSYRLLRLINNLIDMTKIDSGVFQLNLKNYNIAYLVEEIVQSSAQFVKERGIELIFDTDTEDKIIAVDEEKMERVLLNLISNAIKFTDPGGVILVHVSDLGNQVAITVSDTGVGMDPARLNLVFERFHQEDKTKTRNAEGSGIGLSLVRSIVELHGGSIQAQSSPGEGSRFTMILPAHLEASPVDPKGKLFHQSKVDRISIEFSDIYQLK